ncbi:MAG TPA: metallophosphoesterase [Vicinamibacterales bacterium]|nr:metallophosphoesterase [Vicinamibacterales bacterium]
MLFGALGDIHGDFASVQTIVRAHREVPFWLCVGDVADDHGRYESFDAPVYWIKGNNENFDVIASGTFPANLHYISNAQVVTIQHVRVAGLGGTFAPTWYETPAAELPYPGGPGSRVRDDKRRHFVREEVDACRAMRDIDVLLTHEAPRPYFVTSPSAKGRPNDAGKTPINEVLAAMKPRLHLFGHHHRFTEHERQGVRSVGLDLVSRSYLLIDAKTMEYKQLARSMV